VTPQLTNQKSEQALDVVEWEQNCCCSRAAAAVARNNQLSKDMGHNDKLHLIVIYESTSEMNQKKYINGTFRLLQNIK
jgi:hypothetical protein